MPESKEIKSVVQPVSGWSKVGHWVRVVIMFISGGFIFPNAMTEGDEPRRSDHTGEIEKKAK